MKVVDLSHSIFPDMPAYPGTEPPQFATPCTIEKFGFMEKRISLFSHTGTHIDAPAHIIQGAKTLDQLSTDCFIGKASLLDMTSTKKPSIDIVDLKRHRNLVEKSEFVLFHTGWSRLWGDERYFRGYPVLSLEAALWLTDFGLKGLGVDMISVDEAAASDFTIHKAFLERDIIVIENLTNLQELPRTNFIFSCLPLKIERGDGSPVRAVAIID